MTTAATVPTTPPPLIPRSVLFGNPHRMSPALSPDGERLAFLAPAASGVLNVHAGPWRRREFRPVTADAGRGVRAFAWSADGSRLLYVQDRDGDENTHLYAVDPDAGPGSARDLTPSRAYRPGSSRSTRAGPTGCSSGSTCATRPCTTPTGSTP